MGVGDGTEKKWAGQEEKLIMLLTPRLNLWNHSFLIVRNKTSSNN